MPFEIYNFVKILLSQKFVSFLCRDILSGLCERAQPHRELITGADRFGGGVAPCAAASPLPTRVVRLFLLRLHGGVLLVRRHQPPGRFQDLPSAQLAATGSGAFGRQRRQSHARRAARARLAFLPAAQENRRGPGAAAPRRTVHLSAHRRRQHAALARIRADDATLLAIFQTIFLPQSWVLQENVPFL